jgi:hypothetical protein
VSTKPLIISLDVETYGAFSCWDKGSGACPDQTVFNPALSKQIDRVHLPCRLVPQCAVTIVSGEPSDPTGWEPKETAVFDMCTEQHLVLDLVRNADTIVGSNIVYDLSYLREFSGFASWLVEYPLPTLVDTIILSWLHSGTRKERSLKALGPALGAFAYDRTLKAGKFPFPMCADAIKYNAQDTHNAVLAARALAQRIHDEQGRKLTPSAIMFHSDRLWNILDLSHNGQHFSANELRYATDNLAHTTEVIGAELYKSEIFTSGEGSGSSQSELIDRASSAAADYMLELHDSRLLEYSDKKRSVRNNRENRKVLAAILRDRNPNDADAQLLEYISTYASEHSIEQEIRKILSQRIHRGNDEYIPSGCFTLGDQVSCYPSWYGAPTDEGGVQSVRLSCRRPAAQTWSKDIRELMTDPTGQRVWRMDMTAFELRVAAAISRDRKMRDFAFAHDPYLALPGDRNLAKTALLVGVNGGGPDKAWRTAIATTGRLITLPEVRALPIFSAWQDYANTRSAWFDDGKAGKLRLMEADILYTHSPARTIHDTTSFMVQGTSAVFMTMIQSRLMQDTVDQYRFNLQLHDELIFTTSQTNPAVVRDTIAKSIFIWSNELFGTSLPFTFKLSYTEGTGEARVHHPC